MAVLHLYRVYLDTVHYHTVRSDSGATLDATPGRHHDCDGTTVPRGASMDLPESIATNRVATLRRTELKRLRAFGLQAVVVSWRK